MKFAKISILFLILTFVFGCAENKTESVAEKATETVIQNSAKVQIYYFHGDRRCPTCIAVGEVAEQTVQANYKDNEGVAFIEVNIDQSGTEKLAEKFQVTGSGLYLYSTEKIEDLTAFAFQNARSAPEVLQNKLVELINLNLK